MHGHTQEKPYKFLSKNGAWTVDRHLQLTHNDYVNNIVKPKIKTKFHE